MITRPEQLQPYQNDGIKLDQGLNLVDPKMFIDPGSLKDCLNYEIIDRIGYKRLDGFSRYDGHENPNKEEFFVIYDLDYSGGAAQIAIDYPIGSAIEISGGTGEVFGIVVGGGTAFLAGDALGTRAGITYARVEGDYSPSAGDTIIVSGGAGGFICDSDPIKYSEVSFGDLDPDLLSTNEISTLDSFNSKLRAEITELVNPAVGLHWFHNKLYAFADEDILFFNSGSTELYAGDLIQNTGATFTCRVVDIRTTSGTWGGGDAAGAMLVEVLTGTILTSGDITCTRPNATTLSNVATFATSTAATSESRVPWRAGLWKSRTALQAIEEGDAAADAGWNKLNTGILLNFENGDFSSGDLPILDRKTGTVNTDFDSTVTDTSGTNGVFSQAYYNFNILGDAASTTGTTVNADIDASVLHSTTPADFVTAVEADDGTQNLRFLSQLSDHGGTGVSKRVGFTSAATLQDIPAYARIVGIEVILTDVVPGAEVGATQPYTEMAISTSLFKKAGTSTRIGNAKIENFSNQNGAASTTASITLGSPTDLWGATEIDVNDVLNAEFGVSFKFTSQSFSNTSSSGGQTGYLVTVDRVQIKVYYELEFTRYYFWDGVDDVQADLISFSAFSGTFESGTAAGVLQVANVQECDVPTFDTSIRRSIKPGDEIHVSPGGDPTSKVGDVGTAATDVMVNAPASLGAIQAVKSKYEFITANFYADDTYDAVYAVTGASRAFEFDGQYFVHIYTQEDDTKDIPRHIAFHHYHLALGYRGGQIVFSVVGQPTNYNGVQGAVELAVGDAITGLLPMKGTTLGVFCENSIWGINGTVSDQFATQVLAPKVGAIEYTIVDMGEPIFCTPSGISTLSQSDKYGDFQGQRLSYNVTPWLTKRLRRANATITPANNIVCAIPFRTKNQYRLFFSDGYVLIMTLNPDSTAEFTFAQYYRYDATEEGEEWLDSDYYEARYVVPLALSSQIDDNGEEQIHISHYSTGSLIASDGNEKYVYELDSGWGFDGEFFPSYIDTNWHYQDGPFINNTIRKVRLEGLTHGYAPLVIYTSKDYESSYSTATTPLNLPQTPLATYSRDFISETNIANVAETGRNVSMRIESVAEEVPYPSHILQALLIQFKTGKPDL